jgi:hypothetical protein
VRDKSVREKWCVDLCVKNCGRVVVFALESVREKLREKCVKKLRGFFL